MGYGAPLKNQNKGYAAQEKKDLLKDNPVAKVASGGSFMSKHMSTPLNMGGGKGSGMYMNSPMEKELVGGQKNLPEGLKKAIEASPAEMHGSPMHKHEKGHNDGLKKGSELTKAEIEKMKKQSVFGPGKKVAKPPKKKKEKVEKKKNK